VGDSFVAANGAFGHSVVGGGIGAAGKIPKTVGDLILETRRKNVRSAFAQFNIQNDINASLISECAIKMILSRGIAEQISITRITLQMIIGRTGGTFPMRYFSCSWTVPCA
jgi:hypothetical protein